LAIKWLIDTDFFGYLWKKSVIAPFLEEVLPTSMGRFIVSRNLNESFVRKYG